MNALALGLVILIAVAVLAGAVGWWVRSFWCKGKEGFDASSGSDGATGAAQSPSLEGAILCERELIDYAGEILQDIRDYVVMLKEQTPSSIGGGEEVQSPKLEFLRILHVYVRFVMLSMIDVDINVSNIIAELITSFQASNKDNAYATLLSQVDSLGPRMNHSGILVKVPYFIPYATTREQRDLLASQIAGEIVERHEARQRAAHAAALAADVTGTVPENVTYTYPSPFDAMNKLTNGVLQQLSAALAARSSHDSRYLMQVVIGHYMKKAAGGAGFPTGYTPAALGMSGNGLGQLIQEITASDVLTYSDGFFAINNEKVSFSSCDEATMPPANQADMGRGQQGTSPAHESSTQQAGTNVVDEAEQQAASGETEMDGATGTSAGPSGFNWDNAVVFVRKA